MGYVVEAGGRRVFFSSDLVSIERRYHRRLGPLDLVITDGSYIRRGGLVRIDFFRPFTSRIVITHFGSWFYRNIAASIRRIASFGDGVRTSAARDGLVIDI